MKTPHRARSPGIVARSALPLALALLGGCASFTPPDTVPLRSDRAAAPEPTLTYRDLRSLPAPRGTIAAAVYAFRDQTGQYKPAPSNTLSTAVTQGADTILMKAMLDSSWFSVVERSSLSNLLTERKILQSQRVEQNADSAPLPAVRAAQIILEGSVVSYDSNIHTGGSGLRLLGIGGSQTYREDRVSVNLRVIDIEDGLVLHSVTSQKRIFSRQVSSGVFAYVDEDKILEGESGYSINEPAHLAVTEAIESALINLIYDGVLANSWQLADASDIDSPVFDRYVDEASLERFKERVARTAAAAAERDRIIASVSKRMAAGRAAVAAGREARQALLAEARAKSRREARRRAQAAAARQLDAASASATTRSAPPAAASAPTAEAPEPRAPGAEELVRQSAGAVLRAQAQIQVQATRQAHEAALYAHDLIVQQQRQQQQQQSRGAVENPERSGEVSASVAGAAATRSGPEDDPAKREEVANP